MQYSCYKSLDSNSKLNISDINSVTIRSKLVSRLLMLLITINMGNVIANELSIHVTESTLSSNINEMRPDQLPLSRLAYGQRNIIKAWFAGSTNRYKHGVLGDSLEASQLIVETNKGNQ